MNLDDYVHTIEMKVLTVTPEVSDYLLHHNYANQRAVSNSNVEKFVRLIEDGKWNPLFGSPIQFDPDANGGEGVMYDAQHRCLAVKKTGKTVEMLLNTDVDESCFGLLDGGKSRVKKDALTGPEKQKRASLISYAINYEVNGYGSSMFKTEDIPNEWVRQWDESHPGVAIEYARVGDRTRDNMGSYGSGAAFALFAYLLDSIESEKSTVFKNAMQGRLVAENEECLIAINNMKAVERRLKKDNDNRKSAQAMTSFLYVVRAWNAYVGNYEISKIQLNVGKSGRIKFIPMELLGEGE